MMRGGELLLSGENVQKVGPWLAWHRARDLPALGLPALATGISGNAPAIGLT